MFHYNCWLLDEPLNPLDFPYCMKPTQQQFSAAVAAAEEEQEIEQEMKLSVDKKYQDVQGKPEEQDDQDEDDEEDKSSEEESENESLTPERKIRGAYSDYEDANPFSPLLHAPHTPPTPVIIGVRTPTPKNRVQEYAIHSGSPSSSASVSTTKSHEETFKEIIADIRRVNTAVRIVFPSP